VHCAVADTGVGMSDDVRKHAIEPFFTTKGPRGTGLGLSVSHSVIQRHGGQLNLGANEGGGTVITLRLPQAVVVEPARAEPTPAGAPLRILLVDDEPTVREALADTLVEDGHAVVQAPSGPEALARLGEGAAVDLVLTDLGMPEMTGWDVARAVRQRWPGLPIGLVTGWAVALEMSDEERRGVDFVLAKPYTVETLRSALATVRQG
jgi:CheY-like chemotaxis protein